MELSMMKCPYCEHEWVPRVAKPLKCPRCGKILPEKEGA